MGKSKDEKGFAALLIASGIVITVDELGKGDLSPKRYFGLAAAFLCLSLVSTFQPELARLLAWLVFLGILLVRGPRVFEAVTRKVGKGK